MTLEMSAFLSVKYTIMFKLFLIAFCLPYISAAPVSSSVPQYNSFINFLVHNDCQMPKEVNIPYSPSSAWEYLATPLEVCQIDDNFQKSEILYLCKEAFEAVKNITCNSTEVVPPINIPLSSDICQDFTSLQEFIPKTSTNLGARLTDTLTCNVICADELNEVCKFLLWTYQVQHQISIFQAKEKNENVKTNSLDSGMQVDEKAKTIDLDSRKPTENDSEVLANAEVNNFETKISDPAEDIKQPPKQNADGVKPSKNVNAHENLEDKHAEDNEQIKQENGNIISEEQKYRMKLKELSENDSLPQSVNVQTENYSTDVLPGGNSLNEKILPQNQEIGNNDKDANANKIPENPDPDNEITGKSHAKIKSDLNEQNGIGTGDYTKIIIKSHNKQNEHDKHIKNKALDEQKPLPQDDKISNSNDVNDLAKNAVVSKDLVKGHEPANDGKKIITMVNASVATTAEKKFSKNILVGNIVEESVKTNIPVKSAAEMKDAEHIAHVQPTKENITSLTAKDNPELPLILTTVDAPLEQMEGENDNHPADKEQDQYNDMENNEGEYSKSDYDGAIEQPVKQKEPDSKAPSPVIISNEVTLDRTDIEKSFDNFPSRNSIGHVMPDDIQMISSLPDQEDSHFFFYFLSIVLILMAGYLIVHNKQKIIALIVEGRHERRRRSHGVGYKKLETK